MASDGRCRSITTWLLVATVPPGHGGRNIVCITNFQSIRVTREPPGSENVCPQEVRSTEVVYDVV
jgi:hypothetical protein